MAPARHSVESGFGSDENSETNSCSAQREFFNTYLPQLGWLVQQNDEYDDDDPTIDLNQVGKSLATRVPSPIAHVDRPSNHAQAPKPTNTQANNTFNVSKKKDPTSEELDFIVSQFKKGSSYGEKLADIMLKGLEKDLSIEIFKIFSKTGLPENWLPIVRMNNDNTPYVELLIKADVADQAPDSQLNDFTMEHVAYSKYILDHLRNKTRGMKSAVPIQSSGRPQIQNNGNQQQAKSIIQKKISYIPKPSCSTPLAQKKLRVSNVMRGKQDLNDSKRVLPSRACKANLSYRDM